MRKLFKTVLQLFAVLFLFACDHSVQLNINGSGSLTLDNSCGRIEFRSTTFSRAISLNQHFVAGEYDLYPGSLEVLVEPASAGSIEALIFYNTDGEEIADEELAVSMGDRIQLAMMFDRPVYTIEGTLLILPSSYLMCNQQPLISDTLRIRLTD